MNQYLQWLHLVDLLESKCLKRLASAGIQRDFNQHGCFERPMINKKNYLLEIIE